MSLGQGHHPAASGFATGVERGVYPHTAISEPSQQSTLHVYLPPEGSKPVPGLGEVLLQAPGAFGSWFKSLFPWANQTKPYTGLDQQEPPASWFSRFKASLIVDPHQAEFLNLTSSERELVRKIEKQIEDSKESSWKISVDTSECSALGNSITYSILELTSEGAVIKLTCRQYFPIPNLTPNAVGIIEPVVHYSTTYSLVVTSNDEKILNLQDSSIASALYDLAHNICQKK